MGRNSAQLHAVDREYFTCSALPLLVAAMTLAGCAVKSPGKTVVMHSAPVFSPIPARHATNAVDAGDGDLEIAGLRQTMIAHPEDLDARLRLAQAYAAHGFPDVALEHYRLAAERFPNSANAAVRLARALREANLKPDALAALQAFLHANPQKEPGPYEWLGILNDDLRNWKASQLAYETALLYSAPNSSGTAELHNNLGYALLMQSLNQAAAAEFRAALRIRHDLAIARNNLGIALAGNPSEAILNWQAVSGAAAAHNNMAAVLIEHGRFPEARRELETALAYDQHNAQALYNLALVSEKDGHPAVMPASRGTPASAKPGNAFTRWLRSGRNTAKQPGSPVHPVAGQAAERASASAASGSGN